MLLTEELREMYGDTCKVCGTKNHVGYHKIIVTESMNNKKNYVPLCARCHVLACADWLLTQEDLGVGYERTR